MLDRTYRLPGGQRVRVRLARSSDARAIWELAARRGLDIGPLEVARLARFDPRRRLLLAATALIDARETLVGIAGADLDRATGAIEPDTLIVDERIDGLGELLCEALASRARAVAGRRAA